MNKLFIIFLSLISILSIACEKQEAVIPEVINIGPDLFATGELRDAGEDNFTPFYIGIGDTDTELEHIFWQSYYSEGELGQTLIMGAYPLGQISTIPLFGLQFWSDQFPSDQDWTAEEMSDFFAPGNIFEFGHGPGKVELSLSLPIGGPYVSWGASKSSYLIDPVGSLTITSIEDFSYPIATLSSESRYGKIVRATFSGLIGRYDREADWSDGTNTFITDEVVELQDGEVVFYVNYEQE